MRKKADAVIIGGGIHGCSIAYNLAKKGFKDILLLEKDYLTSGGTGRSAAGIRHQFGTEINIRLAQQSIKLMENIPEELEYPQGISLALGGYMLVAYSDKLLNQLTKNVQLQNTIIDVKSEILTPQEVINSMPGIRQEGLLGASFNPRDGHVDPFHLTQAYADAAKRLGVEIYTDTEVVDVKSKGGRVNGVVTKHGDLIETDVVVNAAGAHGKFLGQAVGLNIPVIPERHQIFVTEPLEMFLPFFVLLLDNGAYYKQTPHGSMLLGVGDPKHELKDFNHESSWQFLVDAAAKITSVWPKLADVKIVRQWAGLYDVTPDHQAILGKTEVKGFYLDLGWSGHGLMMGPIVGKLMAQMIAGEEPEIDISPMGLERFKTGKLIPEPACV